MSDEKKPENNAGRMFLKALGVIAVVLMFLAVIGFGMLVGACGGNSGR